MSDEEIARGHVPEAAHWSLERHLLVWGLALVAAWALLYYLSPILTPFVAGIALGYLLDPVADRLQRIGISRLGAALIILGVFLLLVWILALLAVPVLTRQFTGFVVSLPGYLTVLHGLLTEYADKYTGDKLANFLQQLGLENTFSINDLQKYWTDLTAQAPVFVTDFMRSLFSRGVAMINVISLVVLTPVVAFYILLDWDRMVEVLDKLVPPRHRDDAHALARDIDKALAGFLRGQSTVCMFLGVWYAVGLSLIGLNFGFLIGVTAGVLSLIPYVGSITAFVLSIIVALVQAWPHWQLPAEAIGIVAAGLFLDGNVLSPRLVGASVGLHPVWLIFALFAFGTLFGFTGMIVAVPIAAALGVVLRFVGRRYRRSAIYLDRAPPGTEA